MNQVTDSTSQTPNIPFQVNFEEFNISEDSFKPMNKGLGFHNDQKKSSFIPAPREVKTFGTAISQPRASVILSTLNPTQATKSVPHHMPSGLEAFYGTNGNPGNQEQLDNQVILEKPEIKKSYKVAPMGSQFIAWIIDLLVVMSFVAITGALLVVASGISYHVFARLISTQDLIGFSTAIFSIYYLLYFTILDLSTSPGKTIMGIRILATNNKNVSVKHTFTRAIVSLLSGLALFLPMLLDFQGRLSDTKLVR